MNIDSIQNGIVIDHIPAGKGMELYGLLNLETLDCQVAIIKNALSRKMGRKDIIKIDAAIDVDLDLLGYTAPGATINIIRDGVLAEKKTPICRRRSPACSGAKIPAAYPAPSRSCPRYFALPTGRSESTAASTAKPRPENFSDT